MMEQRKSASNLRLKRAKKQDLLFYMLAMIFPVAQFCIFYIGVNLNSFLLMFQKYDIMTGTVTWTFENIKDTFILMTTSVDLLNAAKMSVISWLIILLIGTPLGLSFSYYIFKKLPGKGFIRVFLFLPSIISAIVMVTIYLYFVESAVPSYVNSLFGIKIKGLLENIETRYGAIMFYNIWIGFGVSVLMYSDSMSKIPQEVIESAELEGAVGIREFWYIVLPLAYPTLVTFLIISVAGIFTNQVNLYSFYGPYAPEDLQTYGYYLYNQTQLANGNMAQYPRLSAMGVFLTIVAVPITLLARWGLNKLDPNEA